VRANCASIFFFTTSSCRMHWSTCCSKACVSTPYGSGHSRTPSAVGKVYREFALDHVTCHAFLYACTQIFCRPSNSLCDHSMRAAENRKAPIPFCAKSSAESFGVRRWLLIRSRATLAFARTTSLVALMSPFPVPQYPRYRHASLMSSVLRRSPFILKSGAGLLSLLFRSLSIMSKKVFFTLISMPHHVVNSKVTPVVHGGTSCS